MDFQRAFLRMNHLGSVSYHEIVGIDAEIAQTAADKLELALQIENVEFDSIITAPFQ